MPSSDAGTLHRLQRGIPRFAQPARVSRFDVGLPLAAPATSSLAPSSHPAPQTDPQCPPTANLNKSDWGSRFAALAGQTFAYHSLLSRVLIVFYSGQVIDSSLLLQSPYPPAGAAGQHAAFVPAAGGLPALDPGDAGSLRRHRGPLPIPTTSSRAPRRSPILSRQRRAPAHATVLKACNIAGKPR